MANDGILHPFNWLSFGERRGLSGSCCWEWGGERVWSCQDSSLIPLLSL